MRFQPLLACTEERWNGRQTGGSQNEIVFDAVPDSNDDAMVCRYLVSLNPIVLLGALHTKQLVDVRISKQSGVGNQFNHGECKGAVSWLAILRFSILNHRITYAKPRPIKALALIFFHLGICSLQIMMVG